jgi:plasmid stabilization system protein ParE
MLFRKLLIRPEAEAEIVEAHNWYKLQAEGLSSEFLRAVDACLSAIEREPLAYPIVYKQVRRALVRKFPYSIFFVYEQLDEETERIVVLACFHGRRDPKQWQERAT